MPAATRPYSEELILRNPHSVLAALGTRPLEVLQITLGGGTDRSAWQQVEAEALRYHRPIQSIGKMIPKPESGRASLPHARVRPVKPWHLERLLSAASLGPPYPIYLALDCLQDPRNVGAIFRAAAFFGVKGVILPQDRSAALTEITYDVAAGGLESVPYCRVPNLVGALRWAKSQSIWILGTTEHAAPNYRQVRADRPWLLILGNEERGLRRLTQESCDELCQIRPHGKVSSLNVAVATGILLAHLQNDELRLDI